MTEPRMNIGISFRIGKWVDEEVEWLTDTQYNLITAHGMDLLTKFPTASLNKYVLLGTDGTNDKREVDVSHSGTTVSITGGGTWVGDEVGMRCMFTDGIVSTILSVDTATTVTVDYERSTPYSGTILVGNTDIDTLLGGFAVSSTIDPLGTANVKSYDPDTGMLLLSNARCVRFAPLAQARTVAELGWTNDDNEDGINAHLVGRAVIDPIDFEIGDEPYVQVAIHKQVNCNQQVVESIPGYTGGGTCQCLLHLPQFNEDYYSTIGASGETVLPTKNSMLEPYTVVGSDDPYMVAYGHTLDYDTTPQTLYGYQQEFTSAIANITAVLALSDTEVVAAASGNLYLQKYDGSAWSTVNTLNVTTTASGRLLKLGDGRILFSNPNTLFVINSDGSSLSILDQKDDLSASADGVAVLDNDKIVVACGGTLEYLQWDGSDLTDLGIYDQAWDYMHVAANISDKFVAGYDDELHLLRIDGNAITQLDTYDNEGDTLNAVTRINPTDYHVSVVGGSYILRIIGNSMVKLADTTVVDNLYCNLVDMGEGHWFCKLSNKEYSYDGDGILQAVQNWSNIQAMSVHGQIIATATTTSLLINRKYSTHRRLKLATRDFSFSDAMILPDTTALVTTSLKEDGDVTYLMIGSPTTWSVVKINTADQWESVERITMTEALVDTCYLDTNASIAVSSTGVYVISHIGEGILSSQTLASDIIGVYNVGGGYFLLCKSTGHAELYSISGYTLSQVDTELASGTMAAQIADDTVALVNGVDIQIIKRTGAEIAVIDTLTVGSVLNDIHTLDNAFWDDQRFVYINDDGMSVAYTNDGSTWDATLFADVDATAVLGGYLDNIIVTNGTDVSYYSVKGKSISCWGTMALQNLLARKANLLIKTGLIIQHEGRLTYMTYVNSDVYSTDVSCKMFLGSDDASIQSFAFVQNDPANISHIEWILALDTPLIASRDSVFQLDLIQKWVRIASPGVTQE